MKRKKETKEKKIEPATKKKKINKNIPTKYKGTLEKQRQTRIGICKNINITIETEHRNKTKPRK